MPPHKSRCQDIFVGTGPGALSFMVWMEPVSRLDVPSGPNTTACPLTNLGKKNKSSREVVTRVFVTSLGRSQGAGVAPLGGCGRGPPAATADPSSAGVDPRVQGSLPAAWTGALLLGGGAAAQMKHRRSSSTFYSKFQVCVSVRDDTVSGECPRHPGPWF